MQSEHTIATTSTATKMNYTQLNNRNMAPPPPSSSSQAKYRDVNGRHRDDQVKTMLIMARRKLRHHNRCGANTVKATAPASWRQSRYISWTALTMVVVAVMVVSPLLMLLLVDLVGAETAAQGHQLVHTANGQRHIIKTRSNLGEDEEELTIGQQPFDSHEDEPPPQSQGTTMGDLWPMGSRHQSPEGAQQQQHHHPSTAAVVQSAEAQSARLPKKRENDNMDDVFDPFAPVFDDYLREASGTTRFSDSDDLSEFGVTQQLQTGRSKDDDDLDNQIIAGRTGLSAELIEDDDQTTTNTNNNNNNDMNSPARAVDRISGEEGSSDRRQQFADNGARETLLPSEAATSVNHHESSDEQNRLQTTTGQNHRAQDTSENNNNNINNKETGAPNDAGTQLANEIRLLFAWHSMPTNKCSKSCGRGLRVMHLICKDLKYDVRVEDELCLRANLGRPSELSDEPCNEIDCEPNWEEVAIERCNSNQDDGSISNNNNNGDGVVSRKTLPREECRSKSVFKRLECTMINRFGETIRLGESRCNATTTATSDNHSKYSSSSTPPSTDEEFSLIDLNEEIDKERNSILSNDVLFNLESHHGDRHHHSMTTGGQLSTTGTQPMRSGGSSGGSAWSKHFRSNEPFYEPGEWSECSGAPCGQLGRRRRQLTCRLFLSRSSRFVDLPDASCASSAADEPDREEPCYMDCGPSTGYSVAVASAAAPEPHSTDQPKQLAAPSSSGDESQHHHHHNQHDKSSNAELTLPSHKQQVESALEAGIKPADLDDETIYDLEAARYGWRHGAWTKCSAECLRGTSESIVECWDKVAETSVDEKFCNSLTKPGPISKTCNEIPCAFQWHPGPFSSCSSACGSAGVRVREVLCVRRTPVTGATLVNIYQQQHHGHHTGGLSESGPLDGSRANNDASAGSAATAPAYHLEIVPEEHCIEQQQLNNTSASSSSGPITATATTSANTNSSSSSSQQQNHHHVKPHSMEPCNRHDCKPQWQVGPWGECSVSGRCGRAAEHGVRNRTVICVQEFASQYGPSNKLDGMINDTEQHDASISPDLREAISLAAASWQPGKAIQVPYSECYRHYHSVPPISEHCREDQGKACPVRDDEARLTSTIGGGGASTAAAETMETASGSIDSDPLQDFRMISADGRLLSGGHHNQLRRRTITLKVGGRAQIMEGWNVKIRCRLTKRPTTTTTPNQNNQHQHQSGKQEASVSSGLVSKQASLVSSANYFGSGSSTRAQVEWRKDGVRIFAPNTTVAEKQLLEDTDNSIQNYGNDEMNRQEDDTYSMMAADEPPEAKLGRRHQRAFVRERRPGVSGGSRSNHQQQQQRLATASAKTNSRVLRVRSWSSSLAPAPELSSFQFVAQKGGRFSLVKENTLRIKRLKLDDSGLYTCTSGPFSESIEINVVGRRRLSSAGLDQNQASPNNYNQ